MKKVAVIALVVLGIAFAGASEAASPKKHRTRNQNRVGPYVSGFIGMTKFTDDQSAAEAAVLEPAAVSESDGCQDESPRVLWRLV